MKTSRQSATELALLRALESAWLVRFEIVDDLVSALLGVYEAKTLREAKRIALVGLRSRRRKGKRAEVYRDRGTETQR